MKEIEVTVTLRNALVKSRRIERGWTQKELARMAGVSLPSVGAAEGLKPISIEHAQKIAAALDTSPDQLFPESLANIQKNRITRAFDVEELRLLPGIVPSPLLEWTKTEESIDADVVRGAINQAIDGLNERHREIIVSRFGLNGKDPMTLEALAHRFKLTRERLRQIEARAVRKLRNPLLSGKILHALDPEIYDRDGRQIRKRLVG